MKYEARIRDIKPADPGYFYVTYEYTDEHGSVQHVRAENARPITPFDIQKTHTINIINGQFKENINKGIKTIIAFFAIMLGIVLAVSLLQEIAIALIFVFFFSIPIFSFVNERKQEHKRKRISAVVNPVDGVIVSYKEVVKRSKNSTSRYYYPVVEYSYGGYTFQHICQEHEEPLHKDDKCLVYIDTQDEFIACERETKAKNHAWTHLIPGLFFLLPALGISMAVLLPDKTKANVISYFSNTDASKLISNMMLIPFVFVAIALLFLLGKQILRLLVINKIMRNEPAISARLISEETYGTATVCKYEYMYQGAVKTHTVKYKMSPEELYVNPQTLECYTAGDRNQTILLVVILGIFTLLFVGSLLIFL